MGGIYCHGVHDFMDLNALQWLGSGPSSASKYVWTGLWRMKGAHTWLAKIVKQKALVIKRYLEEEIKKLKDQTNYQHLERMTDEEIEKNSGAEKTSMTSIRALICLFP